jgi:hypothetical protein
MGVKLFSSKGEAEENRQCLRTESLYIYIHIYIYIYIYTRHVFKVRSGEPLKITHKR